ncbi:hypothetical protein GC090_07555 [Pantoea sp. JZ29]|nr:hypothetical protein GC090_07555 [Pantoea sp. JZ29]
MGLLKRALMIILKPLVLQYTPTVLTLIFSVIQVSFFPKAPLWLISLFFCSFFSVLNGDF